MFKFFILFVSFKCSLALLGSRFSATPKGTGSYNYESKYYHSHVDHFSFCNETKFELKYLFSCTHFENGGPIFFYAGNEGSIEVFAENSGFIWELAKQLKAVVIFAEHRYYGTSLPFGNDSLKDRTYFGYLTAEQALADYALLLSELKANYSYFSHSPVIVFGGSYGGMLAAWFRLKYPNIVAGSIAASAPLWLFPNLSNCNGFNMVVTRSFESVGGDKCVSNIRRLWPSISNIALGPDGLKLLTRVFKLCSILIRPEDLVDYLIDFFGTVAMVNYPYNTSFIGTLPAWPVKVFCSYLSEFDPEQIDIVTVQSVAAALHSLIFFDGKQTCVNIEGNSPGLDANGWDIQTCLEMTTPICSTGQTDMFPPLPWDLEQFSQHCLKKYGVKPRTYWSTVQFWGKNLHTASNIVFTNGLLDPWSAFSVLNASAVPLSTVFNITDGAHHLDLRASNPADPKSVLDARDIEKNKIIEWIKEWKTTH